MSKRGKNIGLALVGIFSGITAAWLACFAFGEARRGDVAWKPLLMSAAFGAVQFVCLRITFKNLGQDVR